jgi:hypothetical protein
MVQVATARELQPVFVTIVQLASVDSLAISDEQRASFVRDPVVGVRAFARSCAWTEAIEHPQLVEQLQASSRGSQSVEVQTLELICREDVMLVTVNGDLPIAIGYVLCKPDQELRAHSTLASSDPHLISYIRRPFYLVGVASPRGMLLVCGGFHVIAALDS